MGTIAFIACELFKFKFKSLSKIFRFVKFYQEFNVMQGSILANDLQKIGNCVEMQQVIFWTKRMWFCYAERPAYRTNTANALFQYLLNRLLNKG